MFEAFNPPETVGCLLSGASPKNSPALPVPDAHAMVTRILSASLPTPPHSTHPSPLGQHSDGTTVRKWTQASVNPPPFTGWCNLPFDQIVFSPHVIETWLSLHLALLTGTYPSHSSLPCRKQAGSIAWMPQGTGHARTVCSLAWRSSGELALLGSAEEAAVQGDDMTQGRAPPFVPNVFQLPGPCRI